MKKRTQYTVEFKINAITECSKSIGTQAEFCYSMGINLDTFKTWVVRYNRGELRLDNAIAVSRRPKSVNKRRIKFNGESWIQYATPKEVINIDGVDYIREVV